MFGQETKQQLRKKYIQIGEGREFGENIVCCVLPLSSLLQFCGTQKPSKWGGVI